MKKRISQTLMFIVLLIIFNTRGFSQTDFKKGYYIDNEGNRTECLIKNMDWRFNPINFKYKLTEDSGQKILSIENIQEFGIYNVSKFERHIVNIDRSSNNINDLSRQRKPEFFEEKLFLKVLVSGDATLYYFADSKIERFFLKMKTSVIEQLIYKRYYRFDEKQQKDILSQNIDYKQQILMNLRCSNIDKNQILRLNYQQKDLIKLFVKYNECKNVEYVSFENYQKRNLFRLNIRPGINYNLFTADYAYNYLHSGQYVFGNILTYRIGIEAEIYLPFNKNKWSLIFEPTYQYYKNDYKNLISLNMKAIEVPFGFRHHFYIGSNSEIFINFSGNMTKFLKSGTWEHWFRKDLKFQTGVSYLYGVGYKFMDKFSAEVRMIRNREIFGSYSYWSSTFSVYSLVFGYSLF